MKKEFSPEEKLLRLIRGSGRKNNPKDDDQAKKPEPPKEEQPRPEPPKPEPPKPEPPKAEPPEVEPPMSVQSNVEPPKLKPREFFTPPASIPAPLGQEAKREAPRAAHAISLSMPFKLKGLSARTFNALLIVILAGLIIYFMYDIVYTAFYKKAEIKVIVDDGSVTMRSVEMGSVEVKPYSHYSHSISGRNIFKPQQVEVEQVITGPSVDEIRARMSLIGIIAGARPQAIIEDKKSGKSSFLYTGGMMGESKIVEIMDDTVILEYKGQRFELIL